MDSTAVVAATQGVVNVWYVELVKLAVFSVFVTGIVETAKYFLGAILSPENYKRLVTPDRLKFLTFGIALYICQALDYGILQRVIEAGKAVKQGQAQWADFIGTASLCMMGATWAFSKFSTALETLKAQKAKALNGGATS